MSRLLFLLLSNGRLTGGQKMVLRHVETLRELGFNAACLLGAGSVEPKGLAHRAPILPAQPIRPDDLVVIPDDASEALKRMARSPARTVVLAQGGFALPAVGADALDLHPPERFPVIIAAGELLAARARRLYPHAHVEIVPPFVDERFFGPAVAKGRAITHTPSKRLFETAAIHGLFKRLHPRHADFEWVGLTGAAEADVAAAFATAGVHLSLNRLESVGLTTLEAMASGCVCAGFLGGGGVQYATPENGFWAPDDDCEAAADALAQAADLFRTGGAPLKRMVEAGRETARAWSYERFRTALSEVWTRTAPHARLAA